MQQGKAAGLLEPNHDLLVALKLKHYIKNPLGEVYTAGREGPSSSLVRTPPLHGGGPGFKSPRAHQALHRIYNPFTPPF